MNNTVEIIKNLKESDYYDFVNLHIHTNESDGIMTPSEVIESAIKSGLRTISITDHNSVKAYDKIDQPNDIQIIKGVEFDCWYGYTLLHMLGYGIDTNNTDLRKLCARKKIATEMDLVRFFNNRKAKNVIEIIKNSGGLAVLAHPACCWNFNLDKMISKLKNYGLDGLEVYYPYDGHRGIIKFYTLNHVKHIAQAQNLLITGGTDSHGKNLKGR